MCNFVLNQVIVSCDEKESHAGDLGNIATPIFGDTSIDLVDRILTLGDGGLRSVLINQNAIVTELLLIGGPEIEVYWFLMWRDIAGRAIVIHAGTDDLGV